MTDPIQPAGEWRVLSVKEVYDMAPDERAKFLRHVREYVAKVDPYIPLQSQRSGDLDGWKDFAAEVVKQKRREKADTWDEGYLEAARDMDPQGAAGVMPWQLAKNPYRS